METQDVVTTVSTAKTPDVDERLADDAIAIDAGAADADAAADSSVRVAIALCASLSTPQLRAVAASVAALLQRRAEADSSAAAPPAAARGRADARFAALPAQPPPELAPARHSGRMWRPSLFAGEDAEGGRARWWHVQDAQPGGGAAATVLAEHDAADAEGALRVPIGEIRELRLGAASERELELVVLDRSDGNLVATVVKLLCPDAAEARGWLHRLQFEAEKAALATGSFDPVEGLCSLLLPVLEPCPLVSDDVRLLLFQAPPEPQPAGEEPQLREMRRWLLGLGVPPSRAAAAAAVMLAEQITLDGIAPFAGSAQQLQVVTTQRMAQLGLEDADARRVVEAASFWRVGEIPGEDFSMDAMRFSFHLPYTTEVFSASFPLEDNISEFIAKALKCSAWKKPFGAPDYTSAVDACRAQMGKAAKIEAVQFRVRILLNDGEGGRESWEDLVDFDARGARETQLRGVPAIFRCVQSNTTPVMMLADTMIGLQKEAQMQRIVRSTARGTVQTPFTFDDQLPARVFQRIAQSIACLARSAQLATRRLTHSGNELLATRASAALRMAAAQQAAKLAEYEVTVHGMSSTYLVVSASTVREEASPSSAKVCELASSKLVVALETQIIAGRKRLLIAADGDRPGGWISVRAASGTQLVQGPARHTIKTKCSSTSTATDVVRAFLGAKRSNSATASAIADELRTNISGDGFHIQRSGLAETLFGDDELLDYTCVLDCLLTDQMIELSVLESEPAVDALASADVPEDLRLWVKQLSWMAPTDARATEEAGAAVASRSDSDSDSDSEDGVFQRLDTFASTDQELAQTSMKQGVALHMRMSQTLTAAASEAKLQKQRAYWPMRAAPSSASLGTGSAAGLDRFTFGASLSGAAFSSAPQSKARDAPVLEAPPDTERAAWRESVTEESVASPLSIGILERLAFDPEFSIAERHFERLAFWERRAQFAHLPELLPPLLAIAPNWNAKSTADMLALVGRWAELKTPQSMKLVDNAFFARLSELQKADDVEIILRVLKLKAVKGLSRLSDGELELYVPQLVLTLKSRSELVHTSAVGQFLLYRALRSPFRIGQAMYWQLRAEMSNERLFVKFGMLLRQYLDNSPAHRAELIKQEWLVHQFRKVARNVLYSRFKPGTKNEPTPAAERLTQFRNDLKGVSLLGDSVRMPCNAGLQGRKIVIDKCRFLSSGDAKNPKYPLWIVFDNRDPHGKPFSIIFKDGDDARQDMLVLNTFRVFQHVIQSARIDAPLTPYGCTVLAPMVGMIEVVAESDTLANICTDLAMEKSGITQIGKVIRGQLDDSLLKQWLQKHNPDEAAYAVAVDRFVKSCAACCVATYVLGITDRHNDNILLCTDGRLVHIDFGHFLGHVKTALAGTFNRDATPFVLTDSFAEIMGGTKSEAFNSFTQLSCVLYELLRRQSALFYSILELDLAMDLEELKESDLLFFAKRFNAGFTPDEARAHLLEQIKVALDTWNTRLNWIGHTIKHKSFNN